MAIVDGLIGGYAKTSVVLGTSKTGVGLAGQILSLFGTSTQPEPLKLEDITSSLIAALSQNEAKVQSAKIMLVSRWLDHYISKSIALSAAGGNAAQYLSDYDKQEFRGDGDSGSEAVSGCAPALVSEVRALSLMPGINRALNHLSFTPSTPCPHSRIAPSVTQR